MECLCFIVLFVLKIDLYVCLSRWRGLPSLSPFLTLVFIKMCLLTNYFSRLFVKRLGRVGCLTFKAHLLTWPLNYLPSRKPGINFDNKKWIFRILCVVHSVHFLLFASEVHKAIQSYY